MARPEALSAKRFVAHWFADAHGLLHRAVFQIKSRLARLVGDNAQERRHGHNRGGLDAFNHFQHQHGRRRPDPRQRATEFTQPHPVGETGDETTVQRHGHQHRVERRQSGALEGKVLVEREPAQIGLGQHPEQRPVGRAAGGDDFDHLFCAARKENPGCVPRARACPLWARLPAAARPTRLETARDNTASVPPRGGRSRPRLVQMRGSCFAGFHGAHSKQVAARLPAAAPVARQQPMTRALAMASASALMVLPAMNRFWIFAARNERAGTW